MRSAAALATLKRADQVDHHRALEVWASGIGAFLAEHAAGAEDARAVDRDIEPAECFAARPSHWRRRPLRC